MGLSPPRLDVPVSTMMIEVQWPEVHEVKFTGSAQAVDSFSHALPKPVNHDVGTHIVESSFDFNRAPPQIPKAGVNVQVPRSGRRHRFQQLLVVDGGATLTASYQTKNEKPQTSQSWFAPLFERFCSRRR